MRYIRKRIKQPTTWLGLAAVAMTLASTGGVVSQDVISSLLVALGLVHVDEQGAT